MVKRVLSLGFLAIGLTSALPSFALESLVTYDQFDGVDGDIDRNLWGPTYGPVEQKRFINDAGQLELGQRVLAKGTTSTGATAATYSLNFYSPSTVKEMGATITILGAGAEPCSANTDVGFSAARIAGSFFSNGTKTAGSQLNDIIAQVRLERTADSTAAEGVTNVVARVDQCTSSDCLTTTTLSRNVLGAAVLPNTAVRVYLRWEQSSKTFYFRRGSDAYVTYTYTFNDSVAPSVPFKGLQIRNKVENCALAGANRSGWAAATFDNVVVNASADRTPTTP
jgi:hypothetical protein